MSKYKLTNKAQRDHINIYDYSKKKWSTIQADKYLKSIINEMRLHFFQTIKALASLVVI